MPRTPDCWETCGNCANGEVFVLDVHVQPGEVVRHDDSLITLETGKVALDIPSPHAGRIVAVHVVAGATFQEGGLIATLETD